MFILVALTHAIVVLQDYEARTAQEELLRARTDALVAKMEKDCS